MNASIKKWLIYIAIFIAGFAIAAGAKNTDTKYVVSCPQEATWKQLKEIDDEGFGLAAEAMGVSARGFFAVAENNPNKLDEAVRELGDLTKKINETSIRRKEVLRKLGY